MPTTSIRAVTAARLVALLRAEPALATATVAYGHPGEHLTGDSFVCVVLADGGTLERANFKGGRHHRDDRYTLEVHVAIFAGPDDEFGLDAAQVAESLAGPVQDVIAENPQLALDGNGLSGLVAAETTRYSGPDVYKFADGYVAECQIDVSCHARLT